MPARILIVLIVMAEYGALPSAAQQLLSNPDFDTTIDDWQVMESIGQQWSAEDGEGRAGSGSLAASSKETAPGTQFFLTRTPPTPLACIPVTPGETIYVRIMYKSASSMTRVYFDYYPDSTCSGSYSFSPYIAWGGPATWWHTIRGFAIIPVSGVGAFRFAVNATGSTPYTITVDHAYAGRTPSPFVDGFECGATWEWSAVMQQ